MASIAATFQSNEISESQLIDRRWFWLTIAFALVTIFTFSEPEEFKSNLYGTESLIPAKYLSLTKSMIRVVAFSIVGLAILAMSYRRNIVPYLIRFLPLIGFISWAYCTVFWSAMPKMSFTQTSSFLLLSLFAFVISIHWSCEKDTSRILKTMSLVLLGISVSLIVLWAIAPKYGALTRSSTGLLHATSSGSCATLAILICLLSKYLWNWSWTTKLCLIAIPIHLSVMMIGGNRWSLAMLILVVMIASLLLWRKERLALAFVAIGFFGFVYLLCDPSLLMIHDSVEKADVLITQGQTKQQLKSLSGRAEMWTEIMRSFSHSPWKGHGYFVTSKTGDLYVWYFWGNWTAHSLYLQVLVTTGIVGGLLFLAFAVQMGVGVIGLLLSGDASKIRIAIFSSMMLLWFAGWGVMNSSIFGPTQPEGVIFFVVIGLLTGQMFRQPMPTPTAQE